MVNDGNDDNKIEPLLQYSTTGPRTNTPPSLIPLPEHNEVTLSDRLIFGPFPPSHHDSSSLLIDALFQKSSPSTSAGSSTLHPLLPSPEHNLPARSGLHRSKTAPAMVANYNDLYLKTNQKTESSDSKFAVRREAVALLIVYVSLSALIYWLNRDDYVVNKTHPVVDALYFCIVTICTFGYGDITPDSVTTKLFSIMFVLVGFSFMGLFLYVVLRKNYKSEAPRNDCTRIWLKVGLALGLVALLYLGFGVIIMHFFEKIGWFDSFYLSVVYATTVGYGDRAFKTLPGRLLAAIWLLMSTLAVAQLFLYSTDKRKRERAKRVLCEPMDISQFFAADIDNNGCISTAEYVIYKLKMMEKITDFDINLIVKHFDELDRTNTGSITLMDLLETTTNR